MSEKRPFSHARRLLVPPFAALGVLALMGPASAHVTVSSPDASAAGFGKVVFRVPNESDSASTTKLVVTLPGSTPFAFVSSKPVPGWKLTSTEVRFSEPKKIGDFTVSKTVSTVTWTAQGDAGIAPGEFEEFELSVGPFPETDKAIELPATQTYSDGEVVAWDEPTPARGEEPEHPAPALELTDAAAPVSAATTTQTVAKVSSSDPVARSLGAGALALGVAAVVVALLARRRVRP